MIDGIPHGPDPGATTRQVGRLVLLLPALWLLVRGASSRYREPTVD